MDIQEIEMYLKKLLKEQEEVERVCDASLGLLRSLFSDALNRIENDAKGKGFDSCDISTLIDEVDCILKKKEISLPLEEQRKTVVKCEKALQLLAKNNPIDFGSMQSLGDKQRILNEIIAEHFTREGRICIADTFIEESGVEVSQELRENFLVLVSVVQAIDSGDLGPAIEWIYKYQSLIDESKSYLDFHLYRARYIQILTRPIAYGSDWKYNVMEAQEFAKKYLSKFVRTHYKNLQELACAMLYVPDIDSSPYASLAHPSLYSSVRSLFVKEFCRIHGYTPDPPLHVIARVGYVTLPYISKMSYVLRTRAVQDIPKDRAIPLELPPLPNQKFHSVLSCPISKEPSSGDNPPIMLSCGHVICMNCVACLSKGATPYRFKCPYCPVESSNHDSLRLYI